MIMLNIVYGNKQYIYEYKIDDTTYQLAYRGHISTLRGLIDDYNWKLLDDLNFKNVDQYCINKFGGKPNNIIFFGMNNGHWKLNNENCSAYIYIIIDEISHSSKIRNPRIELFKHIKNLKLLLSFGYMFNMYFPKLENLPIFFPHSAVYNINFNNNPKNKILVSGHTGGKYPMRELMVKKTISNSSIIYYAPPSYKYTKNYLKRHTTRFAGEDYIKLLNRYLICFVDDMNERVPAINAKIFEILSSGSLLFFCNEYVNSICDIIGLKDNYNYISCDSKNIDDKINYILDSKNKKEINIIRKRGYDLAKNKHYYYHRAKFVNDLVHENIKLKEEEFIHPSVYYNFTSTKFLTLNYNN